jgi:hypothetical protein
MDLDIFFINWIVLAVFYQLFPYCDYFDGFYKHTSIEMELMEVTSKKK